MRRFNFDEYIKNPSKEVVTRDGKTVRILCTDADSNKPIVALVRNRHFEQVVMYDKDGSGPTYSHDLFFATVKKEGWVEVYESQDGEKFPGGTIYATEEEAEKKAPSSRLAIAKIEWEE